MSSSIDGLRFVKCPRCFKILAEFADVPVYECGSCGTTLKAKVRASASGKTSTESLDNNFQKLAESIFSVNKSTETSKISLKADQQVDKVVQSDIIESHANTMRREELVEHGENSVAETSPEKITKASQVVSVDEEMDKSLISTQEDPRVSLDVVYNDANMIKDDIEQTSLAYSGSVSSLEQHGALVPNAYQHEPTISSARHKKSLSTDDTTGYRTQFQTLPTNSPRKTTFGSEDFHSVQNWMGSEVDDDLISIPAEQLVRGNSLKSSNISYSENEHLKILKKMDELRDELGEFLTKKVNRKKSSLFKPNPTNFLRSEQLKYKVPVEYNELKNHTKLKTQPVKQYYRPVYGGAPFVICYKCWKLLQLPADFLVSKKRLHKLRCGSCSEVLVFSFRSKIHNSLDSPSEGLHPPSEAENHNDSVSRSETYSYELEPAVNVSRSSSFSIKEQEIMRVNASKLHGLMGYNSASELLFDGSASSQMTTPEFYRPPRVDGRRYEWYGAGTSKMKPTNVDTEEELHEQDATRRRGFVLHGLLKKGVQDLSRGLESMKLKVHKRG